MGTLAFLYCVGMCFFLFLFETCIAGVKNVGRMSPGFEGSQMDWIADDGIFLVSNNTNFGFGFITTSDVSLFLLAIVHRSSRTEVWAANKDTPVKNSEAFVFDDGGNAYLRNGGTIVWSSNTTKRGVSAMELRDSGNLVLVGTDGFVIWQSFSYPTNTLLTSQEFREGMKLQSNLNRPNSNNLSHSLEIKLGDMILSADFQPSQPYWSMANDNRRTLNKDGGDVALATITSNSWRFYDQNKALLWQFIFSGSTDSNATWIAVLGDDGFISFYNLQSTGLSDASPTKIPRDSCSRPEPCGPYLVCNSGNRCQCPSVLGSSKNCYPGFDSPCQNPKGSIDLVYAGDGIGYFALDLVPRTSGTDLSGCRDSCLNNCSCVAMFFKNSSRSCYMFNKIGSLQGSNSDAGLVSYIKVLSSGEKSGNDRGSHKGFPIVIIIVIITVFVIIGLLLGGFIYYKKEKKMKLQESSREGSEEDTFLEALSGMPVRFSYEELQNATNNFSHKLGQGGFGSVYKGVLPDGTQVAAKKLESIGQGKKEFRAEVSIIGSIHHLHLVRLKGFCAEGSHRLLVYEYMANGSLDKWLFRKNKEDFLLDWDTRYNIAVQTAKGLAYLHEDCDAKIVHCDIKPENVLLDDNFLAKVSDFGLAKLMTREQSHVFTTLRGTRGYLAPEWITNCAISEKSDVYSYGMVLLEIIGGRKNYDPSETSQKSYFPSFVFKMMEEGKLKDIIDLKMKIDYEDERVSVAIKVALWCIQDDINLRPSMGKVVQMLEGVCPVPPPSHTFQTGSRFYSSIWLSSSEGGTSSAPSDSNSNSYAYLSSTQLSGPR